MMIVLIIISIVAMIMFFSIDEESVALPFIILCIKIIALAILMASIVNGRVIDKKIKLIEQTNKEIESKVETSVKAYMEYEGKTFENLKMDSYIQLVNLYPDLKSDELIKQEIKLYQKNINEIKDLKMEKIEISNYKWWVYFGK